MGLVAALGTSMTASWQSMTSMHGGSDLFYKIVVELWIASGQHIAPSGTAAPHPLSGNQSQQNDLLRHRVAHLVMALQSNQKNEKESERASPRNRSPGRSPRVTAPSGGSVGEHGICDTACRCFVFLKFCAVVPPSQDQMTLCVNWMKKLRLRSDLTPM